MTETAAGRFEQAGWLLAEVGHRRGYWAAGGHPFNERWLAGELEPRELQAYAEEHYHVVVTLAEVAQRAAALADGMLGEQLGRVADARERDVELWCAFAGATGWSESIAWHYAVEPLPETEAGLRIWAGDAERSLEAHLVTLYTLETAQAEVARPQLHALLDFYGFSDDDRTGYFRRRRLGDAGPAGLIEAALTGRLPVADPFALVRHAELTCRAYWELLDGVDRFTRAPRPSCVARSGTS
jgi:pyrroloquinoline quinone (PQQ) biosynthesis protein C